MIRVTGILHAILNPSKAPHRLANRDLTVRLILVELEFAVKYGWALDPWRI
jgi:hypothetical protein